MKNVLRLAILFLMIVQSSYSAAYSSSSYYLKKAKIVV